MRADSPLLRRFISAGSFLVFQLCAVFWLGTIVICTWRYTTSGLEGLRDFLLHSAPIPLDMRMWGVPRWDLVVARYVCVALITFVFGYLGRSSMRAFFRTIRSAFENRPGS